MATSNGGLGDLDKYKGTQTTSTKFNNKLNNIFGIVRAIGIVISVVMLTAIGIKFMMGSVEEKAEYKQTLIPYVVGAAVVFLGTWLPQFIYDITNDVI